MTLVLADKLETLAWDNFTERARGDASMGYSSVLLGQLILFNGPLARYHLIRKCYDHFDLKP